MQERIYFGIRSVFDAWPRKGEYWMGFGDAGVYREAILSHDWREIDASTGEGMIACDE
jgi:hypothetical protein